MHSTNTTHSECNIRASSLQRLHRTHSVCGRRSHIHRSTAQDASTNKQFSTLVKSLAQSIQWCNSTWLHHFITSWYSIALIEKGHKAPMKLSGAGFRYLMDPISALLYIREACSYYDPPELPLVLTHRNAWPHCFNHPIITLSVGWKPVYTCSHCHLATTYLLIS